MKPDKPSSTARLIARSIVFVSRDSEVGRLVPPQAARASTWFLEATTQRPDRLLWLIDRWWFRALVAGAQSVTIPGILLHYVVRKRFLEDVARSALESGTEQVVVLGAGFDTLALRLCQEFPATTFIEIDHPATQEIKAQVLESQGCNNANLHLLPVNLAQERLAARLLASPHYQDERRTLFVAEGLLMYLEPDKVGELFRFVAQHSGRGSRFAFTFLEPQRGGKVDFRRGSTLIQWWLKWRGEGFRWGIKRRNLERYATGQGLVLHEVVGERGLRARYLQNSGAARARLARGEYIGVAERE